MDPHALQNIGKYHVAVKTRSDAQTLPAFTVRARPPLEKAEAQAVQAIRERSIEQNGLLPAEAVEAWLDARYYSTGEPEADTASHDGLEDYE